MSKRCLHLIRVLRHIHRHRALQPFTRLRNIPLRPFSKLVISVLTGFSTVAAFNVGIVLAKEAIPSKLVIEKADKLYHSGDYKTLYVYLESYKESTDVNLLWRFARAARDLALKSDVKSDEKKRLIYEAHEFSKRALELDDGNFAAHKWFAITTGDVGDYEGVKVKISNAYLIREHLERATKINPNDATTLHCLGMWCYVFADMPRWQHTIAGMIFATPPTSTFEDAADFFYKAERADPGFYSVNLLMLGKSYMKMGDLKRAMLYLGKASQFDCGNHEDQEAKKEATTLLEKIIKKK